MSGPTCLLFAGPPGAGKTTLCHWLLEEWLARHTSAQSPPRLSALVVDAEWDQGLSLAFLGHLPSRAHTVAPLLEVLTQKPGLSVDVLDDALQERLQPITLLAPPHRLDLLTLGELPLRLPPVALSHWQTGFRRLLAHYSLLWVDGHHPLVTSLLPLEQQQRLWLLSPAFWRQADPLAGVAGLEALAQGASLILNRITPGMGWRSLPEALQTHLDALGVRVLGKIPEVAPSEPNDPATWLEPLMTRLHLA